MNKVIIGCGQKFGLLICGEIMMGKMRLCDKCSKLQKGVQDE